MSPRPTAWGAYAQIAEVLRQRIATKELVPGQPFPSESALSAEFSVARNTVRRALAELEAEGLTRTVPGTGRIVREPGSTDDAEGAQPQYRRIAAELRARIDSGELAPGDPVPSEATVARNFRVSRGTARQALTDLEGAGLIVAVPGKGRFVRVTEEPER
nr:GntR family transcriptional regulator [Allonocardiopsis opalescens]